MKQGAAGKQFAPRKMYQTGGWDARGEAVTRVANICLTSVTRGLLCVIVPDLVAQW